MEYAPSVELVTATLTLRTLEPSDAPALFAMSQERGMREWLPDQVYADQAEALEVVRQFGASDRPPDPRAAPVVLGVCASGQLIGHVGLSRARDVIEIGYAIADAHQGRGYATEAVRTMTAWGLEVCALASIDGIVAADNVASCRVLERAGFAIVEEGVRAMHGVARRVRIYRCARG